MKKYIDVIISFIGIVVFSVLNLRSGNSIYIGFACASLILMIFLIVFHINNKTK